MARTKKQDMTNETLANADSERAEALASFLDSANRANPGAVMKLNESPKVQIDVIPTGAISLDVAIGAGGFPRGKIVELYGGEGGGKCLVAGTYVWTDAGLETIEELFNRCGQKASNTTRTTDVRNLGVSAVNELGEVEQIAALTHNYTRPTWKITVESGRHVEATANHPLRVISANGFIEWRKVKDIKEGDVIVSGRFGPLETGCSELSEDEALFLGYLVAEGSLGQEHSFNFTNWDPEVAAEYCMLARKVTGRDPVNYYDKEYRTYGKELRSDLVSRYGLDFVNAAGKSVPYSVRTAGRQRQIQFLSALYEGDGWVHNNQIGFASASRTLAEQVQLLLLGLGIPATLVAKWNEKYERDYFTVLVSSSVSKRFLDTVGFRSTRRNQQVVANTREVRGESWVEDIPNVGHLVASLGAAVGSDREFKDIAGDLFRDDLNLTRRIDASRERLMRILNWAKTRNLNESAKSIVAHLQHLVETVYTYERVVSVEATGEKPTFDLFVPGTSSFLANGVLSHNTTVALTVAANAQKMGGNVGFIDAEHGLNRQLCNNIGIDPDRFVVAQPDNGEEAIDMVEKMIRSKAFDVVIVDSVAAMTPKAEIESEIEQQFMGLHARLMSKFMRRVAGLANENGVMLILVNQIRKNLAAYGTPDETTGGKAIKFYASLRIEVRTSGSKKLTKGSETVGHTVVATVKKNRLGAPHTTAEFDLIYGKGIDGTGALLDVAEKVGVVSRSGAYYTDNLTGERFSETGADGKLRSVVGKEAVKDLLRRDTELHDRLIESVYTALKTGALPLISTTDAESSSEEQ